MKQKIRDFIHEEVDIDVLDDYTEECYIAFCGPMKLTKKGEQEFKDALDLEVEYKPGDRVVTILVDDPDEDKAERNLKAVAHLFYAMAGFDATVEEYDLWFQDDDESDTEPEDDPETAVKNVAHRLLQERFPSSWGVFDSSFYNAVVEDVKASSDWPHWNDNDVSLAVQFVIIRSMKKGVTE